MAIVNFKNSPSEETPLTGGASGTLNVMQENGTTHGSDTKLGYSQAFLNDHIVNISNEVDEDYRVNLLKTKNLFNGELELGIYSGQTGVKENNNGIYRNVNFIPCKPNTTYTLSINGVAQNFVVLPYHKDLTYDTITKQISPVNGVFTTPNDCYYINFRCYSADFTSDFASLKIQLEEGNEATTYEAFVPNQILVDNEKYTDTLNVGSVVDNRSRVNVLYSKNLLSTSLELGTFTNSGVKDTSTTNYRTANMVKVKPNTTYTTSINGTAQAYALYFYTSSGVYISSTTTATFTTPANCEYLNFRCFNADFTSDFANLKVQLEEGSSATSYEPYITPSIVVDNEEIYNKGLSDYSLAEQRIGTWLGKPLYRKVIDCGALPNATTKTVAHSISNIDFLMLKGMYATTGNYFMSIPLVSASAISNNVSGSCDKTNIYIVAGSNRSEYTTTYAILEYTKTTD